MQWLCAHIRSALRQIRKTGDVIYDNAFNIPSASRLAPRPPNAYSPELVHTNGTSSLTCPSEPFIVSFLRLSPPPQTQGWVHNAADLKKKLHFCGGGVENYFFSRLRPIPQTMIPLLPSTVQCSIPGRGHQAVHLEAQWLPVVPCLSLNRSRIPLPLST